MGAEWEKLRATIVSIVMAASSEQTVLILYAGISLVGFKD
jgi:hypothetical protein